MVMKGGVSIKTIIVLVILILVGVLGVLGINTARVYMSGAAGGTEPTEGSVLAKIDEEEGGAVVTWASEKESMGIVEYGTTPASLLLRAVETSETTSHRVILNPLKANTNYYFRIRVGEEVFDNNGIPYSFKTKDKQSAEGGVTVVPTRAVAGGTTPTPGSAGSCDENKDGRVSSIEQARCATAGEASVAPTGGASKCDLNKDGRVSSMEQLKCK